MKILIFDDIFLAHNEYFIDICLANRMTLPLKDVNFIFFFGIDKISFELL